MTRGGKSLENTNGWIPCQSDSSQRCFGIMHIPEISDPIVVDGIGGVDYLINGIRKIIGTVLSNSRTQSVCLDRPTYAEFADS